MIFIKSKFTTTLFFIFLFNVQLHSSLELSSLANLVNPNYKNLTAFQGECDYYDLKSELIIINYVKKVNLVVNTLIQVTNINIENITFEQFRTIFNKGNYGLIATELAESHDYVRSYYNYFLKDGKMTIAEFTQFMGLYYLEGELLVEGYHPTLSIFYPNEHEIKNRRGCKIAIAFWELINNLLMKIYINYHWADITIIEKKEIFEILINTHTGKCWLKYNKDCKFFDEFTAKALGFFNLSSGKNKGLNVSQTKILYSTFLFKDISVQTCKDKKFGKVLIAEKIKNLHK